jgi:hypothetical protein
MERLMALPMMILITPYFERTGHVLNLYVLMGLII